MGSVISARELSHAVAEIEGEKARSRGFEVTFLISQTLKGVAPSDQRVVVEHFQDPEHEAPFKVAEAGSYRLYLKKNAAAGFEPTTGRFEPGISIRLCPKPD